MGKLRVLSIMYDAWVLKLARIPPRVYMDFAGGGIRKKRNAMGMADTIVAFPLYRNDVIPNKKMGKESRWYSNGLNV